jgi:type IV pilus assembly protein PilP
VASASAIAANAGKTANRGRLVSHLGSRVGYPSDFVPPLQIVAQRVDGVPKPYRYDPDGRRDPFESLVKKRPPTVEAGPVIEPTRPRGPLERFDLSSLKLKGIIWGELGRRAIIRAPDGKGYFVTVGMYMGQNGGRIVAIENDRLIIKEKYRDIEGHIIDKTLTIPLRRKDEQQG